MRKKNLMETTAPTGTPVPVETPVPHVPVAVPAIPDSSVPDAVIAARTKIVTRLDAIKAYVLDCMDVESRRDAWTLEIPPESMLEEAEQILEDLRGIGDYTGLEEELAMKEEAETAS